MQPRFAAALPDQAIHPAPAPHPAALAPVDLELEVAQMLCARLCHDLMSPAGAIHMGLDLFADTGGDDGETLKLIEASAREVTTRLSFFRLVFGIDRGNPALVYPEAQRLLTDMLAARRVALHWGGADAIEGAGAKGSDFLRLVCCLVVLAADALPRGGTVRVTCGCAGDGPHLFIVARGPCLRVREDASGGLMATDTRALTARNIDAFFARRLAQRLGATLSVAQTGSDELCLQAITAGGPAVNWLGTGGTSLEVSEEPARLSA